MTGSEEPVPPVIITDATAIHKTLSAILFIMSSPCAHLEGCDRNQSPLRYDRVLSRVLTVSPPAPVPPPLGTARRSWPWPGTTRWPLTVRRGPAPAVPSWHTACRGRDGSAPEVG